jgi:protein disulfide-isomerase
MRLSLLSLLVGASALVAAGDEKKKGGPTTFNGITVPPLLELTPQNFDEEIVKTKWMFVKQHR